MIRKMLIVGTAAVLAAGALTVGMGSAAFAADRYAAPSQPVPYSQLNAYMKGGTSKRAAILSQNTDATAQTGTSANTSATMPITTAPSTVPPTAPDTPTAPMPSAAPAPNAAPMPSATPGAPVNPPADVATPPTSPSSPAPQ